MQYRLLVAIHNRLDREVGAVKIHDIVANWHGMFVATLPPVCHSCIFSGLIIKQPLVVRMIILTLWEREWPIQLTSAILLFGVPSFHASLFSSKKYAICWNMVQISLTKVPSRGGIVIAGMNRCREMHSKRAKYTLGVVGPFTNDWAEVTIVACCAFHFTLLISFDVHQLLFFMRKHH